MSPCQYQIVLVEDSEADAFLVREALEQAGVPCELQTVRDGEEAIIFLETIESDEAASTPNLIILDLNLPMVSGEQVLERIRKTRKCGSTPVIILTSSESPRDKDATVRLGATEYFSKSSRLDEFMKLGVIVRRLLSDKSSEATA
jgi:CheY-like chemotaxis protein